MKLTINTDGTKVFEGTPDELAEVFRKLEPASQLADLLKGVKPPAPQQLPPVLPSPYSPSYPYKYDPIPSPYEIICDACRGGPWFGIMPPTHTCGKPNVVYGTITSTASPYSYTDATGKGIKGSAK